MNYFSECRQCTPPKRYPGCHDYCEAYKKARALFEIDKQKRRQESITKNYFVEHRIATRDGIAKYIKNRPKK